MSHVCIRSETVAEARHRDHCSEDCHDCGHCYICKSDTTINRKTSDIACRSGRSDCTRKRKTLERKESSESSESNELYEPHEPHKKKKESKCANDGCQWRGLRGSSTLHFENCPFRRVACPQGCGAVMTRRSLPRHQQHHCERSTLFCHKCESYVHVKLFLAHQCDFARKQCFFCELLVNTHEYTTHLAVACPMRMQIVSDNEHVYVC